MIEFIKRISPAFNGCDNHTCLVMKWSLYTEDAEILKNTEYNSRIGKEVQSLGGGRHLNFIAAKKFSSASKF